MAWKTTFAAFALAAGLLAPGVGAEEGVDVRTHVDDSGFAVEKDPAKGTVTVGDRVLRVGPGSEVVDLQGRPLTLAELPLRGDRPSMGQSQPGAVHYVAERGGRGEWRVVRLELIEAVPQ